MLSTPLLFLGFNRPDTSSLVWAVICQARPVRLYVALDGPRASHSKDAALCAQVADIVARVDWPCEVRSLIRPRNLGCKRAVSEAIDWFFAHEPEGIILEDDCLPSPGFFRYCEELLDRYRDDERVMSICGDTTMPDPLTLESYRFSRHHGMWGWATWRRAWRHYDVNIAAWPGFRDSGQLRAWSGGERNFVGYWTWVFNRTFAGEIDTWDYQWMFACWANGGLACRPSVNMIRNIGFGPAATHTLDPSNPYANAPALEMSFPISHPPHVVRDVEADKALQLQQYAWPNTLFPRAWRKVKRLMRPRLAALLARVRALCEPAGTRAA